MMLQSGGGVMIEPKPLAKLDKLDFDLIRELETDGRLGVTELSERLRASASTLANRIKGLKEGRAVRFLTLIHPAAIGNPRQVLIAVSTPPSQTEAVALRLAAAPQIHHVSIHTGRYDIFASLSLPQSTDLWQLINPILVSIPEISKAEVMLCLKIAKLSLSLLSPNSICLMDKEVGPFDLDGLDFRLLHYLRLDPRASYAELGEKVGCHRATARRRIERLLREEALQVAAVADPVRLGYPLRANIGLALRPGMVDKAAAAVAASPLTHHVVVTTGSFDMLFTTFFRDQAELSKFCSEYISTIPGIVTYETMVLMKVVKDNFGADWGFAAEAQPSLS
jgi:Lrp/AsnC family transcriptional regulator, regulator for asnA, asnC and gidA